MTSATLVHKSSKVSRELQTALQDDTRRQAIDAAKKRAVGQHVDYDTFKNMVAVAHLRPLQDSVSTQTVIHAPAWCFAPDGLPAKQPDSASLRIATFDPKTAVVPATSDDFVRVWRRQCPTHDSKLGLLTRCGPDHLPALFRVNLPAELLSDILIVLCLVQDPESDPAEVHAERPGHMCSETKAGHTAVDSEHADSAAHSMQARGADSHSKEGFIYTMLQGLSGAGGFSLTVRLLNKAGREAAQDLFSTLQQALKLQPGTMCYSSDQLDQLQDDFGIKRY